MTLTELPNTFAAGDTLKYTEGYTDYPASAGWVLHVQLVGAAGSHSFTATTSPDGTSFDVLVAAATTAAWVAGSYTAQSYVTRATERYTVNTKSFTLTKDLTALSTATDLRTHYEKVLDALEALIENRATVDQLHYTVNGREITMLTPRQLREEHQYYKDKVLALKNGGRSRLPILARF